jgi:hypothetical protein
MFIGVSRRADPGPCRIIVQSERHSNVSPHGLGIVAAKSRELSIYPDHLVVFGSALSLRNTRHIARLAPIAVNLTGKVSAAARDLFPLYIFGVGAQLDAAVIATIPGALLASMAFGGSIAICVPLYARRDADARATARRFFLAMLIVGLACACASPLILRLLGADTTLSGVTILYLASLVAGVLQAASSVVAARLFASNRNVGLLLPFFVGPLTVVLLLISPSLIALAAAYSLGSALDLVLILLALRVSHARARLDSGHRAAVPMSRSSYSFLAASYVVATATILTERAFLARGPTGTVGAVAIAARVASSISVVLAGSYDPRVTVAIARGTRVREYRLVARTTLYVAVATILVLGAIIAFGWSWEILSLALALYLIATPVSLGLRVLRAGVLAQGRYGAELGLMTVGSMITIGVSGAALWADVPPVFALAIPVSTALVGLVCGALVLVRWTPQPLAAG